MGHHIIFKVANRAGLAARSENGLVVYHWVETQAVVGGACLFESAIRSRDSGHVVDSGRFGLVVLV
jgi:hypothetical protein